MPLLPPAQLFQALAESAGLEAGVNVFIPKGRARYYVYFRLGEEQIFHSTGKTALAEAKLEGAKIFANVVAERLKSKETALQTEPRASEASILAKLNEIEAILKNSSVASGLVQAATSKTPTGPKHNLVDAVKEFIKLKKDQCSSSHHDSLRIRCGRFAEYAESAGIKYVEEVTAKLCYEWVRSCQVGKKTEKGYLGDISAFFTWCEQVPQEWIAKNPVSKVPRRKGAKGRGPVAILKPGKVAEFMDYVETNMPEFAAFYALCTFAGIRGDKKDGELKRLAEHVAVHGWDSCIKENVIMILFTKTGAARQFPISANLHAWLKAYPSINVPTPWQHQCLNKLQKLPYNALRHTAISAFVNDTGNMAQAGFFFGNSERMIRNHYLNYLNKDEVAAFYAIMPKKHAASTETPVRAA